VIKSASIKSFGLALIVLIAILIQSLHTFHHALEAFSKRKCHHRVSNFKTQLTHDHRIDHCFTCEFVLFTSHFATPFTIVFYHPKTYLTKTYLINSQIHTFFKGSLFALRAPPFRLK
jgi:hypothetical protein